MNQRVNTEVVIVGAGFSGLGMAIQLKKDGREDFVILEKGDDVGGTWRENTYPGCACDVPSHMYSFSFEQNPNWSQLFARQPEILDYLKRVAVKYDVARHIRFGKTVTSAHWDEDHHHWRVATEEGPEFTGTYLVSGIGALHIPNVPDLPGMNKFSGRVFHSARWDHEYDLRGKRVAVVGTGASAVQFVPEIAPEVGELQLYQRTPAWVLPRPEFTVPEWAKVMFRHLPLTQRICRNAIYWFAEAGAMGFNGRPGLLKAGEWLGRRHLRKQIKDPELRRNLTPDYRLGCKRVLGSNTYYPALARDNAEVVTEGIKEITERGIVASDGRERSVDAIIFGTGFHVTDSFDYLEIVGRNGSNLAEEWRRAGMQTHLGITVAGFPNLFFLLGPNTGLGHNSVVFMIESQIRYVSHAIKLAERESAEALEVRHRIQTEFNHDIQNKLANGVWTTGGCTSWYLDSQGVNRTIWPGFTWQYWARTRKIEPADFELIGYRREHNGEQGDLATSASHAGNGNNHKEEVTW